MKYLVFIIGCLFSVNSGFSQTHTIIDSLKLELSKHKADSIELRILNDLAYYYGFQNIDTSLTYGKMAFTKATKLNNFKAKARSNLYMGNAFLHSNVYDSARYYYNAALKIAKEHNVNQSAMYSSLGMLYKAEGNYEKAIETYFEGINYDEDTNNEYGKFVKLLNLANTYDKLENITKSIEYESKALRLANNSQNKNINFARGTLLNNIGGSYAKLNDLDTALEYFKQSLAVNIENQNKKEIARNYNNIGVILEKQKNFNEAIEFLYKALKIREELGDEDEQVETNMVLGTVYGSMKNGTLSEKHFLKALNIANSINDKSLISEVYLAMSDSYTGQSSYLNALNSFKSHVQFKDSILIENNLKNINEVEIKYQTEKKDKEIISQQLEIQKKKTQNNYMLGGLVFLIVAVVLLVFLFRQRQKRKNQEIVALKRENQIKTLEALIEGEENERLRIAKELHDGVNGDLSAIKYKLSSLLEMNNKVIKEAITMIDDSCMQVRAISHNLIPPSLESFDLREATQVYCTNLNEVTPNISIEFQYIGDTVELPKKAEINAFRIIQELVANAIKHAEASKIDVQISGRDNIVQITVEDNGKGFDRDTISSDGIGLKNIASRIDYLNATTDVISNEKGTSYSFEIDKTVLNDN